jgi:dynein heavy chain
MILGNRYVRVMRSEAELMKKNLQTLSNALDEWVAVQRSWMYLENIFVSSEIKKTLGKEAA